MSGRGKKTERPKDREFYRGLTPVVSDSVQRQNHATELADRYADNKKRSATKRKVKSQKRVHQNIEAGHSRPAKPA